MPSYAKFLKEIMFNKWKLQERAMVSLTKECIVILENKLPPKLEDLGSSSIPCVVGDVPVSGALCDLGASVSLIPYSICKRLQVRELKPTTILFQPVSHSFKHPIGMLEDVYCKSGNFHTLRLLIMEMEEDAPIPIIFGWPILPTAGAKIDVKNGCLSL